MALTPIAGGICVAVLALVLVAGCGDDDEEERAAPTSPTETAPATPRTQTETTPTETTPEEPAPQPETGSPEDEPGGAGDEEPARSQALFTGRGGRIRPRVVRVPPFIAIRVELRSADGRRYALRFGRRRLRVGGEIGSVSARFDGLRPGKVLRGVSRGGLRVRIEATAEPGP
jgi:hypothetical protein